MIRRTLVAMILILVSAGSSLAQQSEITFKSIELSDRLTMLQGEGGFAGENMTLLTGSEGVGVTPDDGRC